MKKSSQQLPQISRSFPAVLYIIVLKTVVLGLLIFFLATLLIYRSSGFDSAKLGVLLSPNDVSNHLLLTQEYLGRGDMSSVERELTLAQNLSLPTTQNPSSSVLGANLSPLKILEKIKNEPQRINNEISFWEKIVAAKPNYRDGYLRLALLNAQIYETQKAKTYLQKAVVLDPNFEATKELENLIK